MSWMGYRAYPLTKYNICNLVEVTLSDNKFDTGVGHYLIRLHFSPTLIVNSRNQYQVELVRRELFPSTVVHAWNRKRLACQD
jgi:hypothetical protein